MRQEARSFRVQISGSKHGLTPILVLLVDGRPGRELQSLVGMVGQRRGRSCASQGSWLACVQRADKRLAVVEDKQLWRCRARVWTSVRGVRFLGETRARQDEMRIEVEGPKHVL